MSAWWPEEVLLQKVRAGVARALSPMQMVDTPHQVATLATLEIHRHTLVAQSTLSAAVEQRLRRQPRVTAAAAAAAAARSPRSPSQASDLTPRIECACPTTPLEP